MKINDKGNVAAKNGVMRARTAKPNNAKVSFADQLKAKQQELDPEAEEQQKREVVEAVGLMVARNAQDAPKPAQLEQEQPTDEEW